MKYPVIETKRLILKELTLDNEKNVEKHFSDPVISRFVEIGKHETAADIIRFHLWDSGCRWGLIKKSNKEFIGTCGFHGWNIESNTAEVGYDLAKKYWGKGYMKEALDAIIAFGFCTMELNSITAIINENNLNSIKFILKMNFIRSEKINNEHDYKYVLTKVL
ncbi:MAG TPA: GNAT family N-acetyltransferase [Chitinispirillaceae bacterium]|nr:GNAT family N-acetyltransferase [Chitinispirillaceae bacterium]